MADVSGASSAGMELTIGNPPLPGNDTTAFAGAFHLELALSRSLMLSARVPLALVMFDEDLAGDDSATALGNVGVGVQALTHSRAGRGNLVTLGGGLVVHLPTASDEGAAGAAAAATTLLHLPDLGRWLPDITTLRLRGDLRLDAGQLFLQSELALDVFLQDGEDELNLQVGLGPGIAVTHQLALLTEFSLIDIDDDTIVNLDAGLRYHGPRSMMGLRLYLPLSDPYRDADLLGVGLDLAARF
jgi:hypothetical protein